MTRRERAAKDGPCWSLPLHLKGTLGTGNMTVIGLISDTHRSQCHSDMSDVLYLQVSVTVTCLMSYTYRSVSDTYRSVSQ